MPSKGKAPRIVSVEWVDAATLSEWSLVEDLPRAATLKRCLSVGYLLDNTRKTVKLSMSVCPEDNSVADVLVIPRANVKKLKQL